MKRHLQTALKIAIPILFWFSLWQVAALIIDNDFMLPTATATLSELFRIITHKDFFITVFMTLLRVIISLAIGIILGIALAILAHKSEPVRTLLTPVISVVKSTPVASFIIILWLLLDGNTLAIFVAVLMVLPIIWQNLMDGYGSIDKELSEVCEIYEFSFSKRMRILVFPALMKYFIPAVITATGLAWKAEIAAEIIAYTKNSIGEHINDAKSIYETATVFAWTLVIILFSIALEKLTKFLLGRLKQ